MKTTLCLLALALIPIGGHAQQMLGGKTEGGGPNGSPATNYPCWRYPIRVINYRKFDLRPLFAWWRDNYSAYQSVLATNMSDKPDVSSLPPSPMPGWHRIKRGHFVSNSSYGWVCDVVIEDMPSHEVTNKIILRSPPVADKAVWDNLVAQYEELESENTGSNQGANPKPRHHMRNPYSYSPQDQQQQQQAAIYNATNVTAANPTGHVPSLKEQLLAALDKFPEGTNYTIDLFAAKIGYLQDGSHRQVYDLGQMYTK